MSWTKFPPYLSDSRGIKMEQKNIQGRIVLSMTQHRAFIQVTMKVSNSGKELSKVLVSSKRELREVEEDLVLQSEDGVGLAFKASILAIRRLTFNNFSRRISSLIVKRMSSSIPPTSGITISITSEPTSSESGVPPSLGYSILEEVDE
nr:hypothetical protein [Tanacetum cinerariifolium]